MATITISNYPIQSIAAMSNYSGSYYTKPTPEQIEIADGQIWFTARGLPLQIRELDANEWIILGTREDNWNSKVVPADVDMTPRSREQIEEYLRENSCFC